MEFGLQFVTHLAPYTVPELVELAERAHARGFEQLWLNDNARYRSVFVVLTAVAARVPLKLGFGALVPYFHHPLDVAEMLGALSELNRGREVSVGIGRGDLGQTPQYVAVQRPLTMLRETAVFLHRALAGEVVPFREFPHLVDYHRLNPAGHLQLAFRPADPVRVYGAGNGPKSLALEGECMDGILFSGKFLLFLRTGRLPTMLAQARAGAMRAGRTTPLRTVAELNVSIGRDRARARHFPRRQLAHSLLGLEVLPYSHAELDRLGLDPERIARLRERFAAGATIEEAADLVEDRMVDAYYLAGTPEDVAPRAIEVVREAREHGIDQIAFAKLGPDYAEAIDCLAADVLPHLR
ncbi:MAG TPA: LLM class flavin-dependent oxidoreductase [Chloroflexota bacterium]|jgi:alkanesulfonate monooxygenase SsuD/methylene tetrahydromethanopterin reductase-like flavin-dependent oxidoreductase (luciferase family)